MEILFHLSKDPYFWISLLLLSASAFGILWLLKELHRSHEEENPLSMEESLTERTINLTHTARMEAVEPKPAPPPKPEIPPPASPPIPSTPPKMEALSISPAAAAPPQEQPLTPQKNDFKDLSERLERMEKIMADMIVKIGQIHPPNQTELLQEVKSISQTLRSNAGTSSTDAKIAQLSAKVEKIYQVIVKLSGAEES